jgi:hypothetical protein
LINIRQIGIRKYSTSNNSSINYLGIAVFSDADKDKLNILNYVKGKAGIYM